MKKTIPARVDVTMRNKPAPTEVSYVMFDTRYGNCLVAESEHGICAVLFGNSKKALVNELSSIAPSAKKKEHTKVPTHIKEYIATGYTPLSIVLHVFGTEFQIKVWKKLLTIPFGKTTNYGSLASLLGNKNLSRAVGGAVGSNKIGYIIPCHRVVTASGQVGGYRWGTGRKKDMLTYEAKVNRN